MYRNYRQQKGQQLEDAKVIFVLGGPGSGKGTQCERIVQQFGCSHLSSGDLLRSEVQSGSERGEELRRVMENGELVSLDVVLALIRDAMISSSSSSSSSRGRVFLIDGYPRELDQGLRFESEVAPCHRVLFFDVSEDVMRARLLKRGETSGRVDDNEETIAKRFRTFQQLTAPVIDHYSEMGKVIRVDASGSVDEVFAVVKAELDAAL